MSIIIKIACSIPQLGQTHSLHFLSFQRRHSFCVHINCKLITHFSGIFCNSIFAKNTVKIKSVQQPQVKNQHEKHETIVGIKNVAIYIWVI